MIIVSIIFGLLAGVLYRCGGSGRYPRYLRVIGVPALTTLLSLILGCHNPIALAVFFGLMVASISTYWDFAFKDWDNYWVHGFMIGISAVPIAYITGHWWMFVFRCIGLAVFMGIWCYGIFEWDVAEEVGRGFVIPSTMFLLF